MMELIALQNEFSFHDGVLDKFILDKQTLILEFELLSFLDEMQYKFAISFFDYSDLQKDKEELIDGINKHSASVLEYEFTPNFCRLFLEVMNYDTRETSVSFLSFSYKNLEIHKLQ